MKTTPVAMMFAVRIHSVILLLFLASLAAAQDAARYNITIEDGLPSDHVYSGLVDRLGYLWLCTPKGVARYNGYEVKLFDVSSGLPNNDVWGLYLDKKDRVWVQSIANSIGYIKDGIYRRAYATEKDRLYYARHITEHEGGIMFASDDFTREKAHIETISQLSIERNDTISFENVYAGHGITGNAVKINNRNQAIAIGKDSCFVFAYEAAGQRLLYACDFSRFYLATMVFNVYFNDYMVFYQEGTPVLRYFHLATCSSDSIVFLDGVGRPQAIQSDFRYGDSYYVVTSENIYRFEGDIKIADTIPVAALGAEDRLLSAKNFLYYFRHPLWGQVSFTDVSGVHIVSGAAGKFKRLVPGDMRRYTYLGVMHNGAGCWWNNNTGRLLTADTGGSTRLSYLSQWQNVTGVQQYDSVRSLLFTRRGMYWLKDGKFTATPVAQTHRESRKVKPGEQYPGLGIVKHIVRRGDNEFFVVFPYGIEQFHFTGTELLISPVAAGRYDRIERDKLRNCLWAYNKNRVLYLAEDKQVAVGSDELALLGIEHIEQIQADTLFGNLFLNDGTNIWLVEPASGRKKKLFARYNIRDCKMSVNGNTVVCAGKFGVLFCKIRGIGRFSRPVLYPNIKMATYTSLYDISVAGRNIFLSTDNGLISVPEPRRQEYYGHTEMRQLYRLVLAYGDSTYKVDEGMALDVEQKQRGIKLDIINPAGTGKPRYRYKIGLSDSWHALDNNELFLPALPPGSYDLLLMVEDDTWRSDIVRVQLAVLPYWWQQGRWQVGLWMAGVILLAVFTWLVVLITRRNVIRKNNKKNELLELELRAVYAQINPHFIFNTLNSALFFIKKNKMDEAHQHILRFSRLLRGYLESSRKRYISVDDEVKNLQHYIELQQTRYGGLFSFSIRVKDISDPQDVMIPSLLLQPLVENAINHGLLPKEEGGRLYVEIARDINSGAVVCTVEDNGIGRERSRRVNLQSGGRKLSQGDQLLKRLTEVFNKYERAGIEIHYTDKEAPDTGTIVTIEINNPYYEQ